MLDMQLLQNELKALPKNERLKLANWLIDSVIESPEEIKEDSPSTENPLLAIAGIFNGGSGNTAENAEDILIKEVQARSGLSKR